MKNYTALLMGILVLCSCKQQAPKAEETTADPEIVYEEYQGEEPTKPEQTEVYEPKPPKVEPYGQNGVPSDAIVLFDGSGFDEWVMSRDSFVRVSSHSILIPTICWARNW